jgi:hypothetical protein
MIDGDRSPGRKGGGSPGELWKWEGRHSCADAGEQPQRAMRAGEWNPGQGAGAALSQRLPK